MKPFKHWIRQEVEEVFGIKEVKKHDLLDAWLNAECTISDEKKERLEALRLFLDENVDLWNEAELKMNFLGPLLLLVNYNTDNYRTFMERPLVAEKDGDTASGTVDFMIAKGRQEPRSPFFSVHEYKPDPTGSKDPLGQLMIALVAIHQANHKEGFEFPLYGVYVIGQFFYFVVFDGKVYAKSRYFAATTEEIFKIYCLLEQVKSYIENVVYEEDSVLA